ncbi:MAG: MFS transporter [Bauldia sp.]
MRQHIRPLAFGALHAFYSAPGQTFFIGLFVASFSAAFHLTPATIGALYLGGTLGAAATLLLLGHWIDHIRLVHYSAACIVALAVACFLAATASGALTLLVALYLLRLTGQGLMVHVESTATARAFDRERGRALGITALGLPLSELAFPPVAVAGITAFGWRPTYALFGAVALFILLPVTQWLLYGITRSPRRSGSRPGAWRGMISGLTVLLRSRYVWAALPAMALMPFCSTAIMFHITTIAADRGWPLGLIAASFPAGATANVLGLFLSGRIIDGLSARKLFVVQSLPLLCGVAVLAAFREPWALPVAFACNGFSGGLSKTTLTAMWAEIFGTETLGSIRSAVAMYMVLISALAPFVFGAALSAGASVSAILTTFVVVGLALLIPPFAAERLALR